MSVIAKATYLRAFNSSYSKVSNNLLLIAILVPHVLLLDGEVTAEKTFLALTLFSTVRFSMTMLVPLAMASMGEAWTSIKRMQVSACLTFPGAIQSH